MVPRVPHRLRWLWKIESVIMLDRGCDLIDLTVFGWMNLLRPGMESVFDVECRDFEAEILLVSRW